MIKVVTRQCEKVNVDLREMGSLLVKKQFELSFNVCKSNLSWPYYVINLVNQNSFSCFSVGKLLNCNRMSIVIFFVIIYFSDFLS